MKKNPLVNAVLAAIYIVAVASIMFYGGNRGDDIPTVLAPIAIISLFTLSAAVMSYLFLYQPLQLYFDGNRKGAVDLFLKTTVIFACITAIFLVLFFSGVLL